MSIRSIAFTAFVLLGCGGPTPPPETPASAAPPASTPAPAAEPPPAADAGTAEAPPAETPPAEDTGTPRERLMRAHFKETADIRKAVIDGTLQATVKPAQALSDMKGLGTPQKGWQPALDAMKNAAQRFGQSPDMPAAAAAISDIGVACGTCHRTGGGPKVEPGSAPAVDKTVASQMKLHAWATERLWEGLYVPSDASWKAGAGALKPGSFAKETLTKGGVHARSAAANFDTIVPTLAGKKTLEERAKAYASLLETCSSCHMATGKK